MRFVFRMAVRETRASWTRLVFFFICIAIGVAAIVSLRSVIQSVRVAFGDEARALVAADVLIATNREWPAETRALIDQRFRESGVEQWTETIELPTMTRAAEGTMAAARMVELRAVGVEFPLYGTVELAQDEPYRYDLLVNRGALVRPELLTLLGIQVGDRIVIGKSTFTIRGTITTEPGRRVGDFSLGPRVLIDRRDLEATGLVTFGSRLRRVLLVKISDARAADRLVERLRDDLGDEFINVRSSRATDDEIGRDFERAENYLSLVGLVIVILGGIAVSSVTRVFVVQKIRSIAVLKCLGAASRQIMAVYLLQVVLLGLAGSVFGVVLAQLVIAAIPLALGDARSLLASVEYGVSLSAAGQGIGIGVLVSLLFSVVPFLRVRHVKPSLLLRDEPLPRSMDVTRLLAAVLVSGALVALTAWQAASWQVGLILCAGFAAVALVLQESGRAMIAALSPLSRARSFAVRHGVLHLSRPGNQTRVILLAVGLGAFFIVGVRSLQASLLEQFAISSSEEAPDMFLMGFQADQVDAMESFLSDPATGVRSVRIMPVLRARVTGVEGRELHLEGFEDVRARGSLGREYTVTYRDRLEPNEQIKAGRFWSGPGADPEVSVERDLSERFQIRVGDIMRFDILGREVRARVTSIRSVDWRDARSGGFMFVFRPGIFEGAPQTFIAPLRGPEGADRRARFQYDLVQRFPNVTVIDFQEILEAIREVMSRVTLAVSVVGGLVLLSGGLILVGAVAMTRFQRVYEAAVFRTLGATTRTIARMLCVEYMALGLAAGSIGSAAAALLTWAVSRYALDMPWRVFPVEHAAGLVATALLVTVIGIAASIDVLRRKPLSTLRAE